MRHFSTRQAAKLLDIGHSTLARYIEMGKVPPPTSVITGGRDTHIWSEDDIERVRKLLPNIPDGRKTRYQKKHSRVSNQQSAKSKTKGKTNKKSKP